MQEPRGTSPAGSLLLDLGSQDCQSPLMSKLPQPWNVVMAVGATTVGT